MSHVAIVETQTAGSGTVFLRPGEYFVGANAQVHTLLGSCVSITLWDPATRIGAMSHFVLANRTGAPPGTPLDGRYGDEALELMLARLARLGVRAGSCEAKIFGGGQMFSDRAARGGADPAVGTRNGDAARRLLVEAGILVRAQHLYGTGYRRIVFDLPSGDVWVRHAALDRSSANGAAEGK